MDNSHRDPRAGQKVKDARGGNAWGRRCRCAGIWLAALALLVLVGFFVWLGFSSGGTDWGHRTLGEGSKAARPAVAHQDRQNPSAYALRSSQPGGSRRISQKILNYGAGDGEVGMIRTSGQTPVGPESFTIGPDGNILVADLVNHRLVVCGPDGTFIRAIDIPGVNLNDVTTDSRGQIFVYDQRRHTLHQGDASGGFATVLQLDPRDIDTRGYFHIAGESVYFADAAARDVLVATLKDGILAPPDLSSGRRSEGIHAESGRLYGVSVVKGEALRLEVRDPDSPSSPHQVEVALADILSARYVGEDRARRYYVQVERLVEGRVILEALAFGPAGERLGVTRLPENDYSIWTAKLMEAGPDGRIVQFLPGEEQARLNLLSE